MNFDEWTKFVRECKKEPIQALVESDFNELEEKLNARIPEEFKNYYLKNNGKSFSEAYSFSPIKYGLSIEKLMYAHEQQDIFYGKKIPFATDMYGHTYALSLENGNYGQILFLQHEYEFDQEYDFVSNSFIDFLNDYVVKEKTFLE